MQKQLADGEADKFNRNMDWATRFSASTRGTLAFRMRPFMLETPFDVYKALEEYNLDGVAEKIECPILITDPEHEQFWPGDAQKLFEAVSTPADKKRLVHFSEAEGADSHCEPRALGLRDQRVFAEAVEQLCGPIRSPRFVLEVNRGGGSWWVRRVLERAGRGRSRQFLAVPEGIGRRRDDAVRFHGAWQVHVGPAVLHEVSGPQNLALISEARRSGAFSGATRSMVRWR